MVCVKCQHCQTNGKLNHVRKINRLRQRRWREKLKKKVIKDSKLNNRLIK